VESKEEENEYVGMATRLIARGQGVGAGWSADASTLIGGTENCLLAEQRGTPKDDPGDLRRASTAGARRHWRRVGDIRPTVSRAASVARCVVVDLRRVWPALRIYRWRSSAARVPCLLWRKPHNEQLAEKESWS